MVLWWIWILIRNCLYVYSVVRGFMKIFNFLFFSFIKDDYVWEEFKNMICYIRSLMLKINISWIFICWIKDYFWLEGVYSYFGSYKWVGLIYFFDNVLFINLGKVYDNIVFYILKLLLLYKLFMVLINRF